MEHVFYVHSPLTEKISFSIAEEVGEKRPIFITEERYTSSLKSEIDIKKIYNFGKAKYNVFRRWREIKRGDKKITESLNSNFHIYVPQTARKKIRLLISHGMCSGFSLMEEGLLSYATEKEIKKKVPPKKEPFARRVAYLGRLGKREFFRQGYDKVYAVSKNAFPNFENVKVINIEFGKNKQKINITSDDCIIVLESLSYLKKGTSCAYIYSLVEVIKRARKKYKNIFFKIHPDSYGNWQENLFRTIIGRWASSPREIGRSTSPEDIAIASGADVLVTLSSTGLYCGLFSDSNVYSFYNLLESSITPEVKEEKPEILGELDWVPEIYWEYVQPFELT